MNSKDFLTDLLTTPSPSGAEQPIQRLIRDRMKRYADEVHTDLHGNVVAVLNPKASRKVMLAGHCDQIAFMIRHISSDGFLYLSALGGIDTGVLQGSRITIYGARGPVTGVIGRKPRHLQGSDERDHAKIDIEKIWVDIGARNRSEAEKRVQVGDTATFELSVIELSNQLFLSPGLDDKVGLFVAMETLRVCSQKKLSVGLYAVSTVQEEMGLRGATTSTFGIHPEVGIAIDVTHANDNPGNENTKTSPCFLGAGPTISSGPNTNPVVGRMLKEAAKRARCPFQPAPSTRPLGNDANAMQLARGGVATAGIGIPNRYMHTQAEVCSYKDIEGAIKILSQFVGSINAKTDFRPI
jgi:putative aminopeptidase FrvX